MTKTGKSNAKRLDKAATHPQVAAGGQPLKGLRAKIAPKSAEITVIKREDLVNVQPLRGVPAAPPRLPAGVPRVIRRRIAAASPSLGMTGHTQPNPPSNYPLRGPLPPWAGQSLTPHGPPRRRMPGDPRIQLARENFNITIVKRQDVPTVGKPLRGATD